jgi:Sulfotransferase family
MHAVRQVWTMKSYGPAAVRVAVRGRREGALLGRDDRLVFVVGSPRSGTTFTAGSIGEQPGLVDLGEVKPLKAALPGLVGLPQDEQETALRRILDRFRRLAFVQHLRGVEQTPETSFVVVAALAAYPGATALHVVRDGRDVVCSLLERGWLSAGRGGHDDAGAGYGAYPRFWVEPERRAEFERVSDARRAAWAWRRYVTSAQQAPAGRTVELRYEDLVADPAAAAARVGGGLHLDPGLLSEAFESAHTNSVGRWRQDLTPEQLADVEAEAGDLLAELGYA